MDFTGLADGTQIIMMNSAGTPFRAVMPVNPGTTDTVMQFTVVANTSGLPNTTIADGTQIRPSALVADPERAQPRTGSITRQLTLNEVSSDGWSARTGGEQLQVQSQKLRSLRRRSDPIPVLPGCSTPLCRETELPAVGDTEIWQIINISADAHPMHTHLTSFQLLDRTPFNLTTGRTPERSQPV